MEAPLRVTGNQPTFQYLTIPYTAIPVLKLSRAYSFLVLLRIACLVVVDSSRSQSVCQVVLQGACASGAICPASFCLALHVWRLTTFSAFPAFRRETDLAECPQQDSNLHVSITVSTA